MIGFGSDKFTIVMVIAPDESNIIVSSCLFDLEEFEGDLKCWEMGIKLFMSNVFADISNHKNTR